MRSHSFAVHTRQRVEMRIITGEVDQALASLHADDGICTLFTPHTTSAISINENADPDVLTDLARAFEALVPAVRFVHGEGNSDAHLLSTIVGVSVSVPVKSGKLKLGRWQGIYFLEFDGPRERQVEVYIA
ncbi:MAG: secondary thiamine-phosphate synthase enzyme YjbQ [Acidobacteriota bacterium]